MTNSKIKMPSRIIAFFLLFTTLFVGTQTSEAFAIDSSISVSSVQNIFPTGSQWDNRQTGQWTAYECQGFAIYTKVNTHNGTVKNWRKIYTINRISDLKAGDIVRYTPYPGNTSSLHSLYIIRVQGDTAYFADANGGGFYNRVRWNGSMNSNSSLGQRVIQSIKNEGTNANPTYIWR